MPFIPVPDTVEAEIRMILDAQHIENTLYFVKTGGWDVTSATSLANALLLWWVSDYSDGCSVQLALNEVKITDLSSISGFTLTVPAPTPKPIGSQAGQALPNNVTLCVSFRTNSRGRSFRGRNYYAGMPEDLVDQNTVKPAELTAILGAYNNLLPLAAGLGIDWAVVSRYSNNAPRVSGVATGVVSVAIVDPVVDSQRRRLPGRGA